MCVPHLLFVFVVFSVPPSSSPPSGAPHTDIFLTYEEVDALPEDKREQFLSLAYQVGENLLCGFAFDREPVPEELIVRQTTIRTPEEQTNTNHHPLTYNIYPSSLLLFALLQENYVNHSCDGNTWYENDHLLIAMRPIRAGEEIFYDYATTEGHSSFSFPQCKCGAANCRGTITGDDWKLPELRAKYGRRFISHILKRIDAENEAKKVDDATSSPTPADNNNAAEHS